MSERARRYAILLLAAAIGVVLAARAQRASESSAVAPPVARSHTAASARDANPLPRLMALGADRCVPCKAMAPILESLRIEYAGQFEVQFIDVWKNPDAGEPYRVYGIPTQIFFDGSVILVTAFAVGHCALIVLAGASAGRLRQILTAAEDGRRLQLWRHGSGVLVLVGGLYLLYSA